MSRRVKTAVTNFYAATLIFTPLLIKAQFYSLPTDHSFNVLTSKVLARRDTLVHPAMQPYIPFFSPRYLNAQDSHLVFKYISDDPGVEVIFKRHFIQVREPEEEFQLNIDPVLNLEAGTDLADSMQRFLYNNTRGIAASGTIGRKFRFETMFIENQSVFPEFLTSESQATKVVPGQGRWKTFKTRGFDYAFATGMASIQVSRNINLQFGHGKHKSGHGYRSLLLSDNGFNYPYVRLTQQWMRGRLRYTNIYASLMNLVPAAVVPTPGLERLFQKKSAAFQTLELSLSKSIQVSFFQGTVFQPGDTKNRQQPGWSFINPVIFSNLAAYGLDHPRLNVLAGADLLLKITNSLSLYSQLMADHDRGGTGFQVGIKYFDAFGMSGLMLQAEHNNTERNAFTGGSSPIYYHYNQNLAYTPVNGTETMVMADYRKKRFFVNARLHSQTCLLGASTVNNVNNARIGYIINPPYNLNVGLGYLGRRNFSTFSGVNPTDYLTISVKTNIYNLYYDF